ncbi:MAG TPA: YbaK/EbsC family protein [Gaiellaceae bacterium]|jgi:Cys-tRNA(Pro) deacylase|nr:YbaK/EbsC family protein [Gaiellaceae bacterium]
MASAWPEPVERVSSVLLRAAVEARIQELPSGTPTAREAAEAIGCEPGEIVKSLVLVCDGAYVLALVPGDRRADERAVAQATGATEVRVARPEEVVHATGFEPGAVAPFPQRAIARTLIDRSLLARETVWVGAGTSAHMAALQPADLQRLTRAEPVDLAQRS